MMVTIWPKHVVLLNLYKTPRNRDLAFVVFDGWIKQAESWKFSFRLYPPLSSGEESVAPIKWLKFDQSFEVHDDEEIIPTPIPKTENCKLTSQFLSRRSTDRYVTLALFVQKGASAL